MAVMPTTAVTGDAAGRAIPLITSLKLQRAVASMKTVTVSQHITLFVAVVVGFIAHGLMQITDKCIDAIAAIECRMACEKKPDHDSTANDSPCRREHGMLTEMQSPQNILTSMMAVATGVAWLATPTSRLPSTSIVVTLHSFAVSAVALSKAAQSYRRTAAWAKRQRNIVNTRRRRSRPPPPSIQMEAIPGV